MSGLAIKVFFFFFYSMFAQFCLSLNVLGGTSLPVPLFCVLPSLFLFRHRTLSCLETMDLCNEGKRRRGGLNRLICLDHGYGAYYDNKAVCQRSPFHLLPHEHCAVLKSE